MFKNLNFCQNLEHFLITFFVGTFFILIFCICFIFVGYQMSSRLKWTSEEEQLLKNLGSCDRKNKWTHIAKIINDQLPSIQRTPKQCRQKYNNHLIFGERSLDGSWSQVEDQSLFRQYRDRGPKWKKISQNFPTKSQNTIKNRFYGNVRKIVRKLNKIGKEKISKSFKPIKEKSIIRIIQPDYGLPELAQNIIDQMQSLREKLLDAIQNGIYEDEPEECQRIEFYIGLIRQIHQFNCKCRFYRNFKSKPNRKNSRTNKNLQSNIIKNSNQTNNSNQGSNENELCSEEQSGSECEMQEEAQIPDEQILMQKKQDEIKTREREGSQKTNEREDTDKKTELRTEYKQLEAVVQIKREMKQKNEKIQVKQNMGPVQHCQEKHAGENSFMKLVLCFVREYCESKDKDSLQWMAK